MSSQNPLNSNTTTGILSNPLLASSSSSSSNTTNNNKTITSSSNNNMTQQQQQQKPSFYKSSSQPHIELPDGHLMGTLPDGTPFYSNSWEFPKRNTPFLEQANERIGIKFECVQGARLWLWNHYGLLLGNITLAAQIFYLPHLFNVKGMKIPLKAVRNGQHEKPVKDSIIIYASHAGNFTGHIGVIVDVRDNNNNYNNSQDQENKKNDIDNNDNDTEHRGFVDIACQNRFNYKWDAGKHCNASFPLHYNKISSTWTIQDHEEPIVGWMIPEFNEDLDKEAVELLREHKRIVEENKQKPGFQVKQVIGAGEVVEPFRPLPKELLDDNNFPSYSSTHTRYAWWNLFMEFHDPAGNESWFPKYFGFVAKGFMPIRECLEKVLLKK